MKHKHGHRHPLLLYRRAMSRTGSLAAMVGVTCTALYFLSLNGIIRFLPYEIMLLLMIGVILAFAILLFTLIARRLAYVQARENAIAFVTPFVRMNISYRRVRSVRPMNVSLLFPKDQTGWGKRQILEPFYGKTAIALHLKGFPISKAFLRLFLSSPMFLPGEDGLVLVVPDWMALSTEIDSMHAIWHKRVKDAQSPRPFGYGLLSKSKKR